MIAEGAEMVNDLYIPVVFPEYKIRVSDIPVVGRVPLLGHAGAFTYDSQTGAITYYEYGRYDVERGGLGLVKIRRYEINDFPGGMNDILAAVSHAAAHDTAIMGSVFEVPSGSAQKIESYVQSINPDNPASRKNGVRVQFFELR